MPHILTKRWPWLTAAAVVLLIWAASFVKVHIGSYDTRKVGNADDIEALKDRQDLNVLFILIDTLRADHLSSWGYPRKTSPVLDLLASRGIRFAHQLSQSSWTKCSMASMWTGVYPARTGITRFEQVLSPDATLPAEIFSAAGYRTAALYRNGWVSPYFGFSQGFEYYEHPGSRPPPANLMRKNPTISKVGSDEDNVEDAIEFLRLHANERWLLYLHMMDVHEYVYDDQHAVFGSAYMDIYDNAILRLNGVIDQLLVYLSKSGLLDKTVIAIASDHGEAFGERGLEGHARFVFKETTEVPFILSLPFRLDPPVVVEQRTRNVDIWPTLLDLVGLPKMEGTDGRSLMPEILAAARGEPAPDAPPLAIAELDRNWGKRGAPAAPTVAVADGKLRYVYTPTLDGKTAREQLFDAATDPSELVDVSAERPEDTARLGAVVRKYLKNSTTAWNEAKSLEIDEIQLNQLRALGYQVP